MRFVTLFFALFTASLLAPPGRAQFGPDQQDLEHQLQRVRPFAEGFAAQVRPNGSYLGVRLLDIDADRARALKLTEEHGVEVADVEEGSPADAAGIRKGDVLVGYNGENVLGVQQFIRLVQETPQGRKVKIQLWRDGKAQTVVVTTGGPKSRYEIPPNTISLDFPEMTTLVPLDIPSPMLVWKNAWLGLECEGVDSQLAQYFGVKRGALVRSVDKGSPAERAGLKAGDVLIAIGNRAVGDPHDMSSYIRSEHQAGRSIPLSLVRDHKPITLTVAPAERQQ
jgi:serine protease Do